jgi:hypothetical protein
VSGDRLTALQKRILHTLADLRPPWTLTGGGALAGFHLAHRSTRDLDLFWRERGSLDRTPADAAHLLRANGLEVQVLRSAPTFSAMRVGDGQEECVVNLVAEPFGPVDTPQRAEVLGATISIDTAHEILVNKLTALLSRSELRDLIDVEALLDAGGDLDRALRDAPRKDAGFSPLTLAWVLKDFDVGTLATAMAVGPAEIEELAAFKERLVQLLVGAAAPE